MCATFEVEGDQTVINLHRYISCKVMYGRLGRQLRRAEFRHEFGNSSDSRAGPTKLDFHNNLYAGKDEESRDNLPRTRPDRVG